MTLAEKVVAALVNPYEGLRETTGNNNRDVPFYPGFLWPDAIHDDAVDPAAFLESYRLLSNLIMEHVKGLLRPLILEFGCGPAHMVHYVYGRCDYIGIDGNPDFVRFNNYLEKHRHRFMFLDLTKPIRLENYAGPVRADLVVSFEVLEHLYPKDVDTMLESVAYHMKDGATFFCTASKKHRSTKDVHLTVESREWWLKKFTEHGFVELDGMAERIMDRHPWNWRHDSTHAFALKRSVG